MVESPTFATTTSPSSILSTSTGRMVAGEVARRRERSAAIDGEVHRCGLSAESPPTFVGRARPDRHVKISRPMHEATILFPLGVRLSTWIVLGVFVFLGVRRRDRRYFFAALVWLASFEAAYDVSMWVMHPQHWYLNVFFFGASVLTVAYFGRSIPRPNLWIGAVVVALWAVWIATGFHVNDHQMIDFDPAAEAVNEAAKTLWAAAILWAFWRLGTGGFTLESSVRLRTGSSVVALPLDGARDRVPPANAENRLAGLPLERRTAASTDSLRELGIVAQGDYGFGERLGCPLDEERIAPVHE